MHGIISDRPNVKVQKKYLEYPLANIFEWKSPVLRSCSFVLYSIDLSSTDFVL